jgi:peptide/nickel transport system substrate-binding protein
MFYRTRSKSPRIRALGCSIVAMAAGMVMLATPSMADEPVRGGTLTIGRSADIFTFDPYNTQDDRSIFTELTVYERLVKLSDDGQSVVPELATKWSVSADGLSADFTLRDGVKFSDGSPLTADDVVFSLTRAIDQQGSWGFLFSPVKSVSKVDDHTIRFTMSEPFAPLLPALSTFAASIYSKANFEKQGEAAGEHPLGTAAFMVDHWDKGESLVLKRNPHYWQEGKPYLDQVEFKVVGDDNARVLQLASGDIDLATDVGANQVDQITGANGKIYTVSGTAVGSVTINEKVKPLDEASVRCALAWSVDRESIAKVVYFGRAKPARSPLPSSTLFYDGNADPVGFDLDKAKQLLAKSSVPNGFNFETQVSSGDTAAQQVAQIWAASLAKIGVNMAIKPVEQTTAQELYNTEKYTMHISGWTNDTPDPDEYMGVALDYQPQNGLHSSYHSEEARNTVLAARKETDPAKRQKLYSDLQRIVSKECPFIYLVEQDRLYASSPAVNGFVPNSQGKYGLENVWKK